MRYFEELLDESRDARDKRVAAVCKALGSVRVCDQPRCKAPATDRVERVAGDDFYRLGAFCEAHADALLAAGTHVITGRVGEPIHDRWAVRP